MPPNLDYGREQSPPPKFNGRRLATAFMTAIVGGLAATLTVFTYAAVIAGTKGAILLGCAAGAAAGMALALALDLRRQIRESN